MHIPSKRHKDISCQRVDCILNENSMRSTSIQSISISVLLLSVPNVQYDQWIRILCTFLDLTLSQSHCVVSFS